MGKRKLRFDVRKNYERKKRCKVIMSSQPLSPLAVMMPVNQCDVHGLHMLCQDKLPAGWIATCVSTSTSDDSLAIYKLQNQPSTASVNIAYMVTICPDCTWTVCVESKMIDISQSGMLNSFVHRINNVDDLVQLLIMIDCSRHCIGNPDDKFSDLVIAHKGSFKNQQGWLNS